MSLRPRNSRSSSAPFSPDDSPIDYSPGGYETGAMSAARALARMFDGTHGQSKEDQQTDLLRDFCRKGNPFPLIAHQWPELIVSEPSEWEFFRDIPAGGLDFITPQMRYAITYGRNPVLRLDWWQRVILAGFFDPTIGEIFIKGCTGAGKGAAVSIANCLWFDVYSESRITLTGRDYTHAILNIFGEVKQWFMRMRFPQPASVLGEGINDGERHYVRVLNPDPSSPTAGEAYSGAHGRNTLYTFDEATSSPDTFFENAEKNARKIIALANPRTMGGKFRDAYKPLGPNEDRIAICRGVLGNRLCVTISGLDCLNVRHRRLKNPVAPIGGITIEGRSYSAGDRITDDHHKKVAPLVPSQIDLNQFEGIRSKADSRLVDVFAYGKFPKEDPEKQIILRGWLDFHISAHAAELPKVDAFALDVARSKDGDKSCLAAGGVDGCHSIKTWQYDDINTLCAAVLNHVRETFGINLATGMNPIVVDVDGLGAGAADILRSAGCWVIEYHGNATSGVDPRVYGNLRCESYATLGRRLNPDDRWRGKSWALPNDIELLEELCAPEKMPASGDALRFLITPKNSDKENVPSIKRRIGRSPDKGDAVAMLFYGVRILHNLNEWFQNFATRELIAYPQAPDIARRESGVDESKPVETDDSLSTYLREQYGALLSGPPPENRPDWNIEYRDQIEAARVAEDSTDPPAPARQSWVSSAFRGD